MRFSSFLVSVGARVVAIGVLCLTALPVSAQVLFQQFYYPIDKPSNGLSWWKQSAGELPALAKLGVYAVWHPVPVKGGSGGVSMGYDPYDLYDLGNKNQKGSVPTNFGTREEYLSYIATAHTNGLRVIADVVLNHTGGADRAEPNPLMEMLGWDDIPDDRKVLSENRPPDYSPTTMNLRSWTGFTPKGYGDVVGKGRFPRDYRHFHPSMVHPDRNPPFHAPEFGSDYCYEAENHYVWNGLCDWGRWFRAQTGVDGFRLDAVKLIDPPFLNDFARQMTQETTATGKPFYLVGEFWDTNHDTLTDFRRATQNQMRLFDFGLFYALWDMVEKPQQFDMRDLWIRRFADREHTVMFVSNHDVDRFQPIKRDRRILPYAIIMTMAGQPSIFYLDYFRSEDKRLPNALETLTKVHNRFAVGAEILRYADRNVLAIERKGNLLGVFHDGGDEKPRTLTLMTAFGAGVRLKAVAQGEGEVPVETTTEKDGRVTVTVSSGGYLLLTRADATDQTNPDRFTHSPLLTTQVWEFADDLDTGRLEEKPKIITLSLKAGASLLVRLTDTLGTGSVMLTLLEESGRTVVKSVGKRQVPLSFRTRVPHTGVYQVMVTAPGQPTTGHLHLTF